MKKYIKRAKNPRYRGMNNVFDHFRDIESGKDWLAWGNWRSTQKDEDYDEWGRRTSPSSGVTGRIVLTASIGMIFDVSADQRYTPPRTESHSHQKTKHTGNKSWGIFFHDVHSKLKNLSRKRDTLSPGEEA
jgi:hypothetical protein